MSTQTSAPFTRPGRRQRPTTPVPQTEHASTHQDPAPAFRKAPSPTPHRLSIDVDDATYRALRITAAERETTIVALVRSAISDRLGE